MHLGMFKYLKSNMKEVKLVCTFVEPIIATISCKSHRYKLSEYPTSWRLRKPYENTKKYFVDATNDAT